MGADTPLRQPIPLARSILWSPAVAGARRPGDVAFPIFLAQPALAAIHEHLAAPAKPGQGLLGFLIGTTCECPDTNVSYLVVDAAQRLSLPIYGDRSMDVVTRMWDRIEAQAAERDGRLIGWYHTHPPLPLALSEHDIETHEHYFAAPWQVALIVGAGEQGEPAAGLFRAGTDKAWPATLLPFYELLSEESIRQGGKKRSFVTWRNYRAYNPLADRAGRAHKAVPAAKDEPAPTPGPRAEVTPPRKAAPRKSDELTFLVTPADYLPRKSGELVFLTSADDVATSPAPSQPAPGSPPSPPSPPFPPPPVSSPRPQRRTPAPPTPTSPGLAPVTSTPPLPPPPSPPSHLTAPPASLASRPSPPSRLSPSPAPPAPPPPPRPPSPTARHEVPPPTPPRPLMPPEPEDLAPEPFEEGAPEAVEEPAAVEETVPEPTPEPVEEEEPAPLPTPRVARPHRTRRRGRWIAVGLVLVAGAGTGLYLRFKPALPRLPSLSSLPFAKHRATTPKPPDTAPAASRRRAPARGPSRPQAAPPAAARARATPPPASPLARLEQTGAALSGAARSFWEYAARYQRGELGCDGLARGLLAVERGWASYSAERSASGVPDPTHAVRDQAVYALVDSVERRFERSGCPRV